MKHTYNTIKAMALLLSMSSLHAGAQCGTPATVPYSENFSSVMANNQLPACWAASSMSNTCLTFTGTGTQGSYAAFQNTPAGTNYFYSRSIQLNAGITYSAAVLYNTGSGGGTNWTDFSLMLSATQSPSGLVSIASTNGPASSAAYTSLTNTFTVPVSGAYYVAIRGTGTAGPSQYLNFDDLAITMPCSVPANQPTISITGPTVLCAGQPATLTANGGGAYIWGGGARSPTFAAVQLTSLPINVTAIYSVTGTSTLTGCTGVASHSIYVKTTPQVTASIVNNPTGEICPGVTVSMVAASNETNVQTTWLPSGPVVTPTASTIYTVAFTNSPNNCTGTQTLSVIVKPTPTITASSSQATTCPGQSVTLTGSGADTYSWIPNGAPGNPLTGVSVVIAPTVQTTYFITGNESGNTCAGSLLFTQYVATCTGLAEQEGQNFNVYPNPNNGSFTINSGSATAKTVSIYDITGKHIYTTNTAEEKINIDLKEVGNGMYYVKIQSPEKTTVVKILKH